MFRPFCLITLLMMSAPSAVLAGNPLLLRDIFPGKTSSAPASMTSLGNDVVFTTDEPLRQSLWKTDGTTQGTVLIRSFPKTTPAPAPDLLHSVGGAVVFRLHQADTGTELWITDGTNAGTALLRDFTSGDASTEFREFQLVGSELYFNAGNQLWKTGGTVATTTLVRDLGAQDGVSYIGSFAEYNGKLYFSASNAAAGQELWVSDGTSAGTVLLKDIAPGSLSSGPRQLVSSPAGLFFFAFVFPAGEQLWRSDGTAAGTTAVDSIRAGFYSSFPSNLTVAGNAIYFTANDGVNGIELWKSTGTAETTAVLKHIAPGKASSSPADLTAIGSTLYFSADDLVHGRQLWKTDGTKDGTVIVRTLLTATSGANPSHLTAVGNKVWFAAAESIHGMELWQTDGTADGTLLMADVQKGSAGSSPQAFFNSTSHLFFTASTSAHGRELWAFDVSSSDPVHVVEFASSAISQIEDERSLRVPVTLTLATGTAFDVPFTVSGLAAVADASVTASPLKFAAGQTTANIVVTLVDDALVEGTETIVIELGTPTLSAVALGDDKLCTFSILEDDVAPALSPALTDQVVGVGDSLSLMSTLTGSAPMKVTWTKGNARVAGLGSPTLDFTPIQLSDAGTYTLRASNQAGATTSTCKVAVVDRASSIQRTDPGRKVKLVARAAGAGLSFRWKKDSVDLPMNDPRYTGVTSLNLVINSVVTDDAGSYVCQVTGPGGSMASGPVQLHVASAAPELLPFSLPDVIGGNDYFFALPFAADPAKAPTQFVCTGLPPGLRCDPLTGIITGRTTLARDFLVTAVASNSAGASPPLSDTFFVFSFPRLAVGRWLALIDRDADTNESLGGVLRLDVSSSGGYSASGMLGWQRFSFTGKLSTAAGLGGFPVLSKTINLSGGRSVELMLQLNEITSQAQGFVRVPGSSSQAGMLGFMAKPDMDTHLVNGAHTYVMTPGSTGPQGNGFLRANLSRNNNITISGRTPSGGAFTASSFLSLLTMVQLFAPLTSERASVLGIVDMDEMASSTISWQKIADTGIRFPAPFGPVDLTVEGGPYELTSPVLGLPVTASGTMNARLVFTAPGWPTHISTEVQCRISKANGITLSTTNPANVRIDRFDPASGLMVGALALVEAGYETRTAPFTLQLVPARGKGYGYVLVPQLADPGANPPTTEATSPILSGKVALEPLVP